jgi:predicted MFS family arabinose efflux permease
MTLAAERWVLPGLVAATFLSLVHYLAFSPLLPAMAGDLHLDIGQLGQMPAAISLAAAMLGLLAGPFADRFGKRRTLLIGVSAFVASATGLALLPSPAALPLVAVLAAIGRATVNPLALAIASAEYEGDQARQAASRITSSLGAAPIIGVPLVTSVAAALDWRAAWLALAVVTAVAQLSLWRVFRDTARSRVRAQTRPPARHLAVAYGALIRHRPSLALLGGTFLMAAGGWSVWAYLGAFVVQRHGFTTLEAGWAWMVVGIGLFAGTFLAGGRLGRAPLEVLFALGGSGAGVCLGLAYLLPMVSWLAIGLIGVGTLLHGITQVASAVMLPQAAPTGRAATMTLRGAASALGAAAGAGVGGLLLQGAGFGALGASSVAFCGVAAALVWLGRANKSENQAASMPWRATQAAT